MYVETKHLSLLKVYFELLLVRLQGKPYNKSKKYLYLETQGFSPREKCKSVCKIAYI